MCVLGKPPFRIKRAKRGPYKRAQSDTFPEVLDSMMHGTEKHHQVQSLWQTMKQTITQPITRNSLTRNNVMMYVNPHAK
jgi:hypothetical protein